MMMMKKKVRKKTTTKSERKTNRNREIKEDIKKNWLFLSLLLLSALTVGR